MIRNKLIKKLNKLVNRLLYLDLLDENYIIRLADKIIRNKRMRK